MLEDFWRLSGPLARALRVSVIKKEASEPPPCWACPEAQRPKFVVKCRPAALSRYCRGGSSQPHGTDFQQSPLETVKESNSF